MKVIKMEIEAFVPGVEGDVDLKEFCSNMANAIKAAIQSSASGYGVSGSIEMSISFSQGEAEIDKDEYGATRDCDCLACRLLRKLKRGEDYTDDLNEVGSEFKGKLTPEVENDLRELLEERRSARFN